MATNPAGAILNYSYSLLEAEATLACHAVGLDPGLGIFHADRRDRASLALDLMEAVRPLVDSYVLALFTQRTLATTDFVETRQGACRLKPRLAGELAETLTAWRHHVAPVVEGVAHTLAESSEARVPRLTPLTRATQRAAWDEPLPNHRRRYCDNCRRQQQAEQASAGRANAASVLARLRAEQRDPGHGGRAAQIRGAKNAVHQRAIHDWTGALPDPAVFTSEIFPGIRHRSVPDLMAATGLSAHYCSMIRLGKRVPHPRHWPAFMQAAQVG